MEQNLNNAHVGRRVPTNVDHVREMSLSRRMPLKDKLSLGPIQKYTIYNRFPFKLILHALLVIFTSMTMQAQVVPNQLMLRSQQNIWYRKFLLNGANDSVPTMDDFNRVKLIFNTKELVDFVDTSLANYYQLFANKSHFENYKNTTNATAYIIDVNN